MSADYNLWWRAGCSSCALFAWFGTFTDWTAYHQVQDPSGRFDDPVLQGTPAGTPDAFRLTFFSLALNAGTASRSPSWSTNFGVYAPNATVSELDFFGEPRVSGATIDIGADEYN